MPLLLAPLIAWFGTFAAGLGAFLTGAITVFVGWFLIFGIGLMVLALDGATGIVSWLLGALYDLLLWAFVSTATVAVSVLPEVEGVTPLVQLSVVYQWFGWANRYVPLSELASLWILYSAFLGGLYVYKATKLIRGGG